MEDWDRDTQPSNTTCGGGGTAAPTFSVGKGGDQTQFRSRGRGKWFDNGSHPKPGIGNDSSTSGQGQSSGSYGSTNTTPSNSMWASGENSSSSNNNDQKFSSYNDDRTEGFNRNQDGNRGGYRNRGGDRGGDRRGGNSYGGGNRDTGRYGGDDRRGGGSYQGTRGNSGEFADGGDMPWSSGGGGGGGGNKTSTIDWNEVSQQNSSPNTNEDEGDGNYGGNRSGGGRGGWKDRRGGNSFGGNRKTFNEDAPQGGYGGRSNFKSSDDRPWGGKDDSDKSSGFGGERSDFSGRGRGGRGHGRGGSHQDSDGMGGAPDDEEKPAPYIPPEKQYNEESEIPSGINFQKYSNIPVKVTGSSVPLFIDSFELSGLKDVLLSNVRKAKYNEPTPVQKYSIPIIMANRDMMSCAQTGSGKTAAYLLPMLHNLVDIAVPCSNPLCQEPYVLILAPTRELADQIYSEAYKFSRGTNLRCFAAYGGMATFHMYKQLDTGCHVLIATTGRLKDILDKERLSLARLKYLVLDEADRMLDMGFRPDIDHIVSHKTMPPKENRCTLMFSATFPHEIQVLAADLMNNYVFLAVGEVGAANEDVQQNFILVENFKEKRNKLLELLNVDEKTIVFIEQKRSADFLASFLSQKGYPTTSIHGDRFQAQREEALRDFKCGKRNILVATSVASRGLDIKGVDHVINYDLPKSVDEYVHRIGRTGRVGNLGKATSMYDQSNDRLLTRDLIKILKDAQQKVPDWLEDEGGYMSGTYSGVNRSSNFGGHDIRNQGSCDGGRSTVEHWQNNANAGPGVQSEDVWD